MIRKLRLPSPALVVASVALFVSLGGTAVAAGIVPLAKRALNADNAARLGGKTPAALVAQAAAQPGPASSAAGLVSTKTATESVGPRSGREVVIGCDGGRKAIGGGYSTDAAVLRWDSRPASDTTWAMYLSNVSDSAATVTLYVVCLG